MWFYYKFSKVLVVLEHLTGLHRLAHGLGCPVTGSMVYPAISMRLVRCPW